ncbi:MAG: 30S ribosomal protein S2 [Planctomycetaceae bacterium]|nr:30S ribosomal protein S2 [Planctomycetaceae bacterium]
MPKINVKEIRDAGVHFGHQASRWNPKMRPYIYGRRNRIHIIDLKETVRGLVRAQRYLQKVASQGSLILFVGTKRQASGSIKECAQSCGMPYVSERWLGGMLTNYRTIRNRLNRLEELEALQESGELAGFSKKAQSKMLREYRKVNRNLGGIREMNRLPEAIVVVDPTKERNAVHEAHLLGIKVLALIDTDSDPDLVDLPIPGNDDSMRSIRLIVTHLANAVAAGRGPMPGSEDRSDDAEEDMKPVPSVK